MLRVIFIGAFVIGAIQGQVAAQTNLMCTGPDSCAARQPPCSGGCVDPRGPMGECLPSYCVNGLTASETRNIDLHIYNFSPKDRQSLIKALQN